MTVTVIAEITISTPESEVMEQITITAEEWESPLPRSIVWMNIEQTVEQIIKHRPESALTGESAVTWLKEKGDFR